MTFLSPSSEPKRPPNTRQIRADLEANDLLRAQVDISARPSPKVCAPKSEGLRVQVDILLFGGFLSPLCR